MKVEHFISKKKTIYWFVGILLTFQIINLTSQTGAITFVTGATTTNPGQRTGHQMVYNPVAEELILYGGNRGSADLSPLNSIWKFIINRGEWVEIIPESYPVARYNHRMVYLPKNNSILLYGGTSPTTYERLSDIWIYNLETDMWTELSPPTTPDARSDPGMIYDSLHDRILIFGGYGYDDIKRNDLWEFNIQNCTWKELNPSSSPPVSYGHSFFYRDVDNMPYIFGGHVNGYTNDIRSYNSSVNSWNLLSVGITKPLARYWHCMEYSNMSDSGLLFGGDNGNSAGRALEDTWIFNFTDNSWKQIISENSPPSRTVFSMCYDFNINQMYIYGGLAEDYSVTREDLWRFNFDTLSWSQVIDEPDSSINGYPIYSIGVIGLIMFCYSILKRNKVRIRI